jgi:hypothetical protein
MVLSEKDRRLLSEFIELQGRMHMGWNMVDATVYAILDNHNDGRSERDRRLWNEFMEELRKLAAQEKYAPIRIDVN